MAGTDREAAYKSFSFHLKDATRGKHLVTLGNATNTVWNYLNEISERSALRGPKWGRKSICVA
jgi:putative transposase